VAQTHDSIKYLGIARVELRSAQMQMRKPMSGYVLYNSGNWGCAGDLARAASVA
jgi:hypothetical protein